MWIRDRACKALRKLGYEIVLVNANPATIMTDPEIADVTYIEPLNVNRLEQIIAKERPDAVLPNLGGQSGLNLCAELASEGILDKYGVQVIGVQVDAIERGEDRIEFKKSMDAIGVEMARSQVSYSVDEALAIADELGYPVVLLPAYTMGGAGGGLVYNKEELKNVCARGLQASLVGQVLVEESILGWEELELEIVRDADGNMITVCFIENIDPMGTHTGDSFCSAPMLTISEEVQKRLQEQAYRIVDSVKVIGGTNVQFAHDPVSDRIVVIEINPRTSRSSAPVSYTHLLFYFANQLNHNFRFNSPGRMLFLNFDCSADNCLCLHLSDFRISYSKTTSTMSHHWVELMQGSDDCFDILNGFTLCISQFLNISFLCRNCLLYTSLVSVQYVTFNPFLAGPSTISGV